MHRHRSLVHACKSNSSRLRIHSLLEFCVASGHSAHRFGCLLGASIGVEHIVVVRGSKLVHCVRNHVVDADHMPHVFQAQASVCSWRRRTEITVSLVLDWLFRQGTSKGPSVPPVPMYSVYGKAHSMPRAAGSISRQIKKFCKFLPSSTVCIDPATWRIAMNSPCNRLSTARTPFS